MAGRYFQNEQALEIAIKELFCTASFNGTVFSFTAGRGIATLSKTATGTYKLELSDKYVALRMFKVELQDATARNYTFQIKSYDVNPSTGLAYINFYSLVSATETDIPTGSTLHIKVSLKNMNQQGRV